VFQRRVLLDWITVVAVLLLGAFVVGGPNGASPGWLVSAAAVLLAAIAAAAVFGRMVTRPDHLRAVQSQQILEIANESLAYMRRGLTPATAQEVCRLALRETEAAAVAITDRDTVSVSRDWAKTTTRSAARSSPARPMRRSRVGSTASWPPRRRSAARSATACSRPPSSSLSRRAECRWGR